MLDSDELKSTRKLNGADTKVVIDLKAIEDKISELEEELELKKSDYDNEQFAHISGKIRVLRAIKEGDLSKI